MFPFTRVPVGVPFSDPQPIGALRLELNGFPFMLGLQIVKPNESKAINHPFEPIQTITLVFQGPAKIGSFLILLLVEKGKSAKGLLFQGPGRLRSPFKFKSNSSGRPDGLPEPRQVEHNPQIAIEAVACGSKSGGKLM